LRFIYDSFVEIVQHNLANWIPTLGVFEKNENQWIMHPFTETGEPFFSIPSYFKVNITTLEYNKIAASGILLDKHLLPSGWVSWIYEAESYADFIFSACNNFESFSIITSSGVNVTSYWVELDPGYDSKGIQAAYIGRDSIELFSALFTNYPYSTFKIVAAPIKYAGMEYPGLTLIQHGILSESSDIKNLEIVVSHEIGHNWFGYISDNDPFDEPWLDEGWAMFCTQLYYEYVKEKPLEYLTYIRIDYMIEPLNESLAIINNTLEFWNVYSHYYVRIIYEKSMLVINMLRSQLGNDTFFEIMQEYFNRYSFKQPTTLDLINVTIDVSGENLTEFFDIFLNTAKVVEFRGIDAWFETQHGTLILYIRITQTEENFIEIRMPIRIIFDNGTLVDFVVLFDIYDMIFGVLIKNENVQEVRLDPYFAILDDDPSGNNRRICFGPCISEFGKDSLLLIPIITSILVIFIIKRRKKRTK
jgi:aminopeptidase N